MSKSGKSSSSGPGKPPLELNKSIERAVIRILNYTRIQYYAIEQAVEDSNGLGQDWLRKRVARTFKSRRFCEDRLANDPESAQRQETALEAAMNMYGQNRENTGWHSNRDHPFEYSRDNDNHRMDWTGLGINASQAATASGTSASNGHLRANTGYSNTSIESNSTSSEVFNTSPLTYAEKKRRAKMPNMSVFVQRLEEAAAKLGIPRGLMSHIARRCSATATTVASHISPRLLTPNFPDFGSPRLARFSDRCSDMLRPLPYRTLDSEFYRFYYVPTQEWSLDSSVSNSNAAHRLGRLGALAIIMHAKLRSMADEQTKIYLQRAMPVDGEPRAYAFINGKDEHGVTALHLATACGYGLVCGLLLDSNADYNALTQAGASVSAFARPAQKLAHGDIQLYHAIMQCRQFVQHGKRPPVDDETRAYGDRGHRRTLTDSTIRSGPGTPQHGYSYQADSTQSTVQTTSDPRFARFAQPITPGDTPYGRRASTSSSLSNQSYIAPVSANLSNSKYRSDNPHGVFNFGKQSITPGSLGMTDVQDDDPFMTNTSRTSLPASSNFADHLNHGNHSAPRMGYSVSHTPHSIYEEALLKSGMRGMTVNPHQTNPYGDERFTGSNYPTNNTAAASTPMNIQSNVSDNGNAQFGGRRFNQDTFPNTYWRGLQQPVPQPSATANVARNGAPISPPHQNTPSISTQQSLALTCQHGIMYGDNTFFNCQLCLTSLAWF